MVECVIQSCRLAGIAASVPTHKHTEDDLARDLQVTVSRIVKITGVRTRLLASKDTTASDMCLSAAKSLIRDLDWDPDTIDAIIFVSQTADYRLPATACILQNELGLATDCAAFDVALGCSGFVYGLWQAASMISAGGVRRALILVGDTLSHCVDPTDRVVAPLFGDAGSATALEASRDASPMVFVLGTDGAGARHIIVETGGARRPGQTSDPDYDRLSMDGMEVLNFTMTRVPPMIIRTLELSGWTAADVDYLLLHQANKLLITQIARKVGLPIEKVPTALEDFGNTSGASVPLMCVSHLRQQLAGARHNVLIGGFGVGFSYAAAALTFDGVKISQLVHMQEAKAA